MKEQPNHLFFLSLFLTLRDSVLSGTRGGKSVEAYECDTISYFFSAQNVSDTQLEGVSIYTFDTSAWQ